MTAVFVSRSAGCERVLDAVGRARGSASPVTSSWNAWWASCCSRPRARCVAPVEDDAADVLVAGEVGRDDLELQGSSVAVEQRPLERAR